jgi:hypothetical protein
MAPAAANGCSAPRCGCTSVDLLPFGRSQLCGLLALSTGRPGFAKRPLNPCQMTVWRRSCSRRRRRLSTICARSTSPLCKFISSLERASPLAVSHQKTKPFAADVPSRPSIRRQSAKDTVREQWPLGRGRRSVLSCCCRKWRPSWRPTIGQKSAAARVVSFRLYGGGQLGRAHKSRTDVSRRPPPLGSTSSLNIETGSDSNHNNSDDWRRPPSCAGCAKRRATSRVWRWRRLWIRDK